MDEQTRNQLVKQLDELRDRVSERLGDDPARHDPVASHVEELRALVVDSPANSRDTREVAGGLERKLLAWEADHPQLVSLASSLVRALEAAGL
ncbi:MAG: hypothetical protein JWN48_3472 [Myxococcaceae bacterium]|nr:hypothetical protein [Myxococcaceae bacterium]